MLTKKDAITVGKAITAALVKEQAHKDLQGPDNAARYAARGMCAKALESIYYELPDKVRAQFRYDAAAYIKACDWPA